MAFARMAAIALRMAMCLFYCMWGGHAKGMSESLKERFCGVVKSRMLCGDSGPSKCTGESCCPKSTCYSNHIPFVKCKGSRGPADCVGGKFPTNEGVCQCKYGSCTADGRCPATLVSGPPSRLFDAAATPDRDDGERQEIISLKSASISFLSGGCVLSIAMLALRAHRVVRGSRSQESCEESEPLE